jgi:hypothetical protein
MSKALKLAEAKATAEKLRAWCQNTPSMNMYQPLVTSAVELCLAAAPVRLHICFLSSYWD